MAKNPLYSIKNFDIFCLLSLFLAIIFYINYYFFGDIPNFISNDSFQYLSIAHNIYIDKKFTGLVNYALDLYYDELALSNYDFKQLKPYHFPSYSAFLSLFYLIFDNHNFVVYTSQYLAFLIFLMSSYLILNSYIDKKTSLVITIIATICSPIALYVSDSGKEILCSGLSTLVIYLSLYSPNKYRFYNILISSIILTFLAVTRNFYLLLSVLIIFYHFISNKYKEDATSNELNLKNKFILIFFIFLTPLFAYIYCYHFMGLHLFIFDNRTDIYGGKSIPELLLRSFLNLYLGLIIFVIQYYNFITQELKSELINYHNLYVTFGLSLIGLTLYFGKYLKTYFNNPRIKISRLLIINLFYLSILVAVICRFNLMGYRLTIGYIPFAFLLIYQNFYKKFISGKILLIFFLIINFCIIINNITKSINSKRNDGLTHDYIFSKIEYYNAKNIVISNDYRQLSQLLPLIYKFPKDVNIYSAWRHKFICQNLTNYHNHNIDFDLIFINSAENKSIKELKNCNFVNKNFTIVDYKDGYTFVSRKLNQKYIKDK